MMFRTCLFLTALLVIACGRGEDVPPKPVDSPNGGPVQFLDRGGKTIAGLEKTPFVRITPDGVFLEGFQYVTLGTNFALPAGPTGVALRPLLGAFEAARCEVGSGRPLTGGSWLEGGKGMNIISAGEKICIPGDRFAGDFALIAADETPMSLLKEVIGVARKAGFTGVRIGQKTSKGRYTLISLNHFVRSPRFEYTPDKSAAIPADENPVEKGEAPKPRAPRGRGTAMKAPGKAPSTSPGVKGAGITGILSSQPGILTSGPGRFGEPEDPTKDSILGQIPRRFRHRLHSSDHVQTVALYVGNGGISLTSRIIGVKTGPKVPSVVKLGLPLDAPAVQKLRMALREAQKANREEKDYPDLALLTLEKKTPYHLLWKVVNALRDLPGTPMKSACTLVNPLPTRREIPKASTARLGQVAGTCMFPRLAVLIVDDAEAALKFRIDRAQNPDRNVIGTAGVVGRIQSRNITVQHGRINVFGKLDPLEVRIVVRAHRREVHHCYQEGLKKDKTLSGMVRAAFLILPSGKPRSCEISLHLKDPAVGTCICKRLNTWTFPKPQGGLAKVSFTWVLRPGSK